MILALGASSSSARGPWFDSEKSPLFLLPLNNASRNGEYRERLFPLVSSFVPKWVATTFCNGHFILPLHLVAAAYVAFHPARSTTLEIICATKGITNMRRAQRVSSWCLGTKMLTHVS